MNSFLGNAALTNGNHKPGGSHDDGFHAMLAYIFWHWPYPNTERQRYEQAIVRFQNNLAGSKPPGFIGATSFQIEAVPWLCDLPGYED